MKRGRSQSKKRLKKEDGYVNEGGYVNEQKDR